MENVSITVLLKDFGELLKVRCIIFNSFNELKKAIETHIDFYNNERFNNKVPMKVRLEALNGTENPAQYPTNNSLNYAMV